MPYTMAVKWDDLFDAKQPYVPEAPPAAPAEAAPDAAGRPSVKVVPGHGGVYLLTDAEDQMIQLASAADLKRAIAARLAAGHAQEAGAATGSRRRANLSEVVRWIRWRRADSLFEIACEYYRLARVILPDTYLDQVGFGPCWFVHVDPASSIPRFQAGKLLRSPPGRDLGPFATQTDATRFIEILEDAFDLCRHYHILQQVPHGQACAYFDMGKCPAPCDGSISMDRYRARIEQALSFAIGSRAAACEGWEARMRSAAAERAYERAGALKQHLDRARRIEHESFRFAGDVDRFNYLVVQRGPGPTQVRPFFVRQGELEAGRPARLKEAEVAAAEWIARMSRPPTPAGTADEVRRRSEQLWLVSHFLFRKDTPGLYLRADSLSDAAALAAQVRDCFAVPAVGSAVEESPGGSPIEPRG